MHTGLLKVAQNQHQLATVLGHVLVNHSNERVSTAYATRAGVQQMAKIFSGASAATQERALAVLGLPPSSAWLYLLVGPRKVKPTLSGSISWRAQALIRVRVFNYGSAWMKPAALDRRSFSLLILRPRRVLRTCVNACLRLSRCMRRRVSQARSRAVGKFYEEACSFDSARVRKLATQSTTMPPVIATSATLKTPVRSGPRPRFKKSITLPS